MSSRFYRWRKGGIWDRILENLQQQADSAELIDWEVHGSDSTVVPCPPTCSGGKRGQENQALGRSKGGFSTKVHIRAEGFGKPMVFVLTGGERHDTTAFDDLLAGGKVKRIGRGRPKSRFRYFLGDFGYSSQAIREKLRLRAATPVIPQEKQRKKTRTL